MAVYDPDILAVGLDVVFCGINPAATAAADGHNFSNRSNRFWAVLHQAGFTDVRLRPQDERELLKYGCGVTAVVTRPTQRASEVAADEFRRARPVFEAKMRCYQPRVVAFSRQARPVGNAGDPGCRLGTAGTDPRRFHSLGTAQSKWPEQELHSRRVGS